MLNIYNNIFYAVKSSPGVDGVDLLCRLLMTHGSKQHRTMAIRMPNNVVMRPEKINKNLYCDASALGFNWTRPTIKSIAPINMVTTAMCKTDIYANKFKKYSINKATYLNTFNKKSARNLHTNTLVTWSDEENHYFMQFFIPW